MPSLAEALLTDDEWTVLAGFVNRLEAEYATDLHGVWLYGSRARGEHTGPESDIDLMVVTTNGSEDATRIYTLLHEAAEAAGGGPADFSIRTWDPAHLSRQREIRSFYLQEVDRDKIVLAGGEIPPPPRARGEFERPQAFHHEMSPRSQEFMDAARDSLASARLILDAGRHSRSVGDSYYASFYAARAALSEEDLYAKTHKGTWDLFHRTFVEPGTFDAGVYAKARAAQRPREDADYEAAQFSRADAERIFADAERFVGAVKARFG